MSMFYKVNPPNYQPLFILSRIKNIIQVQYTAIFYVYSLFCHFSVWTGPEMKLYNIVNWKYSFRESARIEPRSVIFLSASSANAIKAIQMRSKW